MLSRLAWTVHFVSRELSEAVTRTTFRRYFPELATEISTIRLTPPGAPPAGEPSRYDKLVTRNAKLKRRNRELTDHLALATAHIQRITSRTNGCGRNSKPPPASPALSTASQVAEFNSSGFAESRNLCIVGVC
ncbi:hypothetical protein ACFTXM_34715 [Streptomyces sp. NPDC056930]|uniref:hypothetical protein n=1 Tax=Streptomyces sp. NPDC056930 TaxID=3345967 RepID=UPI0036455BB9